MCARILSMHGCTVCVFICISVCLPASVSEMCRAGCLLRLASVIFCQFESVRSLEANIKAFCNWVTSLGLRCSPPVATASITCCLYQAAKQQRSSQNGRTLTFHKLFFPNFISLHLGSFSAQCHKKQGNGHTLSSSLLSLCLINPVCPPPHIESLTQGFLWLHSRYCISHSDLLRHCLTEVT